MNSKNQHGSPVPSPELLRRGLEVRQMGPRDARRYVIRELSTGRQSVLSEPDFFILCHLSCHDSLESLEKAYQASFSAPLPSEKIDQAIDRISKARLWGRLALNHPVVGPKVSEQEPGMTNPRRRGIEQQSRQRRRLRIQAKTASGSHGGGEIAAKQSDSDSGGLPIVHEGGGLSADIPYVESTVETVAGPPSAAASLSGSASDMNQTTRSTEGRSQGGRRHGKGNRAPRGSMFPQWILFNPQGFMDVLLPGLRPLRKVLLWSIPILLIVAGFILTNHTENFLSEFERIMGSLSFLARIILSLLTLNLISTFVRGLVARNFGMKVFGFGLRLVFWLLPRFIVAAPLDSAKPKAHRAWVAASPLLVKLFLIGAGIVFWFVSRADDSGLSFFWFWLANMACATFLLTAIPLFPSAGYQLLCIGLDEPELRQKAFGSLKAVITLKPLPEGGGVALMVFGLSSVIFMIGLLGFIFYLLGTYSKLYFSTTGITLSALFILFVLYQIYIRMTKSGERQGAQQGAKKQVGRTQHRAAAGMGQQLRRQQVPSKAIPTMTHKTLEPPPAGRRWLKYAVFLAIIGAMFLPYSYESGGQLLIRPSEYQEITTDFGGTIDEVYVNGGDSLKAGTLIARLNSGGAQRQVSIHNARIREQQATIDNLLSKPTPEELELAEKALEVEETRAAFSKKNLLRKEKIFKKNVISEEEMQDARLEHEVDLGNAREAEARVALVKAGATAEELLAAEAELQRWTEERNLYKDKYEKSFLYVPIDGKLVSQYLKQRTGQYLNKGEIFAVVENTASVLGETEVPEFDAGVIKLGSEVRVRVWAYHDQVFIGRVTSIDTNVEQRSFGNVVKVITVLENGDQRLKTGMTGYAKITGETRPVWEVLFLTILRFVQVEMWSWIP